MFRHLANSLLFILLAAASYPVYIVLEKYAGSKVLFTIHECILTRMLVPILEVNVHKSEENECIVRFKLLDSYFSGLLTC